ncbi:hypothetical protein [Pyxidicoccus xibeiensis]|uniref:hypothetical protein n=1 Tax=Pyxidicoccus xibeiensis TaxID=2906759 RepID=UPI0020A73750|nr:hypothetical protein [Pyxidicoccus xibeiensis]MCP3138562.1 hypothetical protein [Pyxidicoccus xibeiensis]
MTSSESPASRPLHVVAYVVGGLFLANFIPHFMAGIAGRPFQSPFASPPGVGLSSSASNVLWGLINLTVAYALLGRVGHFDHRRWPHLLAVAAGFTVASFLLARYFGRLHGGLL